MTDLAVKYGDTQLAVFISLTGVLCDATDVRFLSNLDVVGTEVRTLDHGHITPGTAGSRLPRLRAIRPRLIRLGAIHLRAMKMISSGDISSLYPRTFRTDEPCCIPLCVHFVVFASYGICECPKYKVKEDWQIVLR